MNKCKFIVIEGADGTGKTHMAARFVDYLNNKGIPAIYTKEPYKIKAKDVMSDDIPLAVQFTKFIADRRDHQQSIKEWLDEGITVVCDRYELSTLVYQLTPLLKCSRINAPFKSYYDSVSAEFYKPDYTVCMVATTQQSKDLIKKRLMERITENNSVVEIEHALHANALYRELHQKNVYHCEIGEGDEYLTSLFNKVYKTVFHRH